MNLIKLRYELIKVIFNPEIHRLRKEDTRAIRARLWIFILIRNLATRRATTIVFLLAAYEKLEDQQKI